MHIPKAAMAVERTRVEGMAEGSAKQQAYVDLPEEQAEAARKAVMDSDAKPEATGSAEPTQLFQQVPEHEQWH